MRLRGRMLLALVLSSVVVSGAVAYTSYALFLSEQARELDRELMIRAEHDAALTNELGLSDARKARIGALDDHVHYFALYDQQGRSLSQSDTFKGHPPELPGVELKRPFDLSFDSADLRGVLWPLPNHGTLLFAAPREELQHDAQRLAQILLTLFLLGVLAAAAFALAVSRSLTASLERVTNVARRISEGDLEVSLNQSDLDQSLEMQSLGGDLNAMVRALKEARGAQRRFISNAAHELRSPLTALTGELELALKRERSGEEYRQALSDALLASRDLHQLAEELLSLAAHAPSREDDTATCAAFVDRALRAARLKADVEIERINIGEQRVRGHTPDLARIVRNLVDNAVAHAPPNSKVTLRIENETEESLDLCVEDHGSGVSDTDAGRLFEAFYRGGIERTHSGAGLGLAIAAELAAPNHASISLARARHPTVFRLRLRRAKVH